MTSKKYLLATLLAGAALIVSCSTTASESDNNTPSPSNSSQQNESKESFNKEEKNGSEPTTKLGRESKEQAEAAQQAAENREEPVFMEIVQIPESITSDEDYVAVPFGELSGTIEQYDNDTLITYEDAAPAAAQQWADELITTGWVISDMDTFEKDGNYTTFLTKGEKAIAIYSSTKDDENTTLIAFSFEG